MKCSTTILLLGLALPLSHSLESPNLLLNPDFESPAISNPNGWEVHSGGIQGWQSRELQLGMGGIYNWNWGKTQVIELDVSANEKYTQKLQLKAGASYKLSVDWASRGGLFETSKGKVIWNDAEIYLIEPKDQQIHTTTITLLAKSGENELSFEGAGPSDGLGLTIDNVSLVELDLPVIAIVEQPKEKVQKKKSQQNLKKQKQVEEKGIVDNILQYAYGKIIGWGRQPLKHN